MQCKLLPDTHIGGDTACFGCVILLGPALHVRIIQFYIQVYRDHMHLQEIFSNASKKHVSLLIRAGPALLPLGWENWWWHAWFMLRGASCFSSYAVQVLLMTLKNVRA